MNNIIYKKGDATAPIGDENKIIIHICNDIGGWGKGFVLALSKRWKKTESAYRDWFSKRGTNDFELGAIQLVQVEEDLFVINMIGQHKIKASNNVKPIRYDAVLSCLEKVKDEALKLDASVHMPRIGCGLAGGKWEKIEPIINQTLIANNIATYVYDFE